MRLADGRELFVKLARDDAARVRLTNEELAASVVPTSLAPELLDSFSCGADDDQTHVLAFRFIPRARELPPWDETSVASVLRLLDELHEVSTGPGLRQLPPLTDSRAMLSGWRRLAARPAQFTESGLRSDSWFRARIATLIEREARAPLGGTAVVHFDLRSDNVLVGTDRTVLVDWEWARRGSPAFDRISWLPSLAAESSLLPWQLAPDADVDTIALVAGYFAFHSTMGSGGAPPAVRRLQRAQAVAALDWLDQVS